MEFGSIRRKNRVSQPSRRKTFSTSNLSCISCSSASVGRKTLYVTLPREFGCEVNLEGRVVRVVKGGPAHSIGIIQIGDYLRIVEDQDTDSNDMDSDVVKLQVTYGVLQVDTRPNCPLLIEIGNRSNTSLGIALTDYPGNKIHISSIQPGSLADRLGFLQPGDMLNSVRITSSETVPCSPYYTSYQIAQILRQLTSKDASIALTILPCCEEKEFPSSSEDIHSGGSDSTITLADRDTSIPSFFSNNFENANSRRHHNNSSDDGMVDDHSKIIEEEDEEESNACVLSMCLWKDRLYEDWGFSLVDQSDGDTESESEEQIEIRKSLIAKANQNCMKRRRGAIVYQIRPGGPAFVAGLRPGDRIVQINDRDVSQLESTMLVPILASLDDALNLMISRIPSTNTTD